MKIKASHLIATTFLVPMLLAFAPEAAYASGGGALPWDTTLTSLQNALTGNTAKVICVIAIFIAGIALVFGEDLGHFAKRLLMIVIAAAFLLGGASFIGVFTPAGGAGI
ncbi:MAG TPA: TrbC/VirB2 family protein [Candidatus Limnocylindria bacterium]|jgi:type IV secretory pathway VirB2 component (pilin)|nr:TrbC/VirB2 family protein [Candidatus Limnocylindria bacterium]